MKPSVEVKSGLDKKFQRVLKTPVSFDFFVAIHDFIEYIESNPSLSGYLSPRLKSNRELNISGKYDSLKQIYQGLEDADIQTNADLGHNRYAALLELNKIRNNDVSESNSFWKKREAFRRMTDEIYKRLDSVI